MRWRSSTCWRQASSTPTPLLLSRPANAQERATDSEKGAELEDLFANARGTDIHNAVKDALVLVFGTFACYGVQPLLLHIASWLQESATKGRSAFDLQFTPTWLSKTRSPVQDIQGLSLVVVEVKEGVSPGETRFVTKTKTSCGTFTPLAATAFFRADLGGLPRGSLYKTF